MQGEGFFGERVSVPLKKTRFIALPRSSRLDRLSLRGHYRDLISPLSQVSHSNLPCPSVHGRLGSSVLVPYAASRARMLF